MARPRKTGFEYFPFDVDFFEDDKIQFVEAVEGPVAVLAYLKLICSLYKVGVCWRWDNIAQVAFASRMNCQPAQIERITKAWLQARLFDPDVYEKTGYLTSKGIQKRYFFAGWRRTEIKVPEGVLLVTDLPEGVTISSYIDNKKEKRKQNPEFFSISTDKNPQKLDKNPKKSKLQQKLEEFEAQGKKKYLQWVYLDDSQLRRVFKNFQKNGLGKDDVAIAIRFLDKWYDDKKHTNTRITRTDDARALIDWPMNKAIERKRQLLNLQVAKNRSGENLKRPRLKEFKFEDDTPATRQLPPEEVRAIIKAEFPDI